MERYVRFEIPPDGIQIASSHAGSKQVRDVRDPDASREAVIAELGEMFDHQIFLS